MTTALVRTMFPGTYMQSDSSKGYPPFSRGQSQYSDQERPYDTVLGSQMEPPRPLEPRPIHQLHRPLSEASAPPQRRDIFHPYGNTVPEYRPQGQNLPGLRDILTATHSGLGLPQYTTWTPSPSGPPPSQSSAGYFSRRLSGLHPPLALQPLTDPNVQYQAQPPRQPEASVVDTRQVPRQAPQSGPVSPYTPYSDSSRDCVEAPRHERPRQASTGSHLANGIHSPFNPIVEDTQYQLTATNQDRHSDSQTSPRGSLPAPDYHKQYLGIRQYAGEGTYHVYEGGHRIPAVVDGEQVNPAWGLTKANKPRKRLALACLDCREKKIKCEPGVGSCLQCEKARRVCRRAPNQQAPSDSTPSTAYSPAADSPARNRPHEGVSNRTPQSNREDAGEASSKRRTREHPSPAGVPTKKHRSASPMLQSREELVPRAEGRSQARAVPVEPSSQKSRVTLAWDEDPFVVSPDTTLQLLDLYFAHVNNATYCMFPRRTFLLWVKTCSDKSQNEQMLLYAVLAVGSIFADDSVLDIGQSCAQIATDAAASKHGRFSLLMAQTRMLLSLYNFANGSEGGAWEFCGSGLRALSALRYGKEDGCLDFSDAAQGARRELGMTKMQLAECRRRTFWAGVLMDRYNGFCGSTLCLIQLSDVYLRLPCLDDAFEDGQSSSAPFYNNGAIDPTQTILTPSSPVAPVAWLALMATLWGEVMSFIYRAVHRAPAGYKDAYESIYSDTHIAFQSWLSRLPQELQYSETNLDRSIQHGYAGTFISIHVLYHFTLMKLNRNVRHALIPESRPRNIRAAYKHAHQLLKIMCSVEAARRDIAHPREGQPAVFSFSTPFPGFAMLSAIDVVSAGSPESHLGSILESIGGGLACLRELAQYWDSAKQQHKDGEKRSYQIKNIIQRPNKARSGAWLGRRWGVMEQLEKDFDLADDCIYGVDENLYFNALEEEDNPGKVLAGGLRMA